MRDWEVSDLFSKPLMPFSDLRKWHHQRFFMREFQNRAETSHQSLMTGCLMLNLQLVVMLFLVANIMISHYLVMGGWGYIVLKRSTPPIRAQSPPSLLFIETSSIIFVSPFIYMTNTF